MVLLLELQLLFQLQRAVPAVSVSFRQRPHGNKHTGSSFSSGPPNGQDNDVSRTRFEDIAEPGARCIHKQDVRRLTGRSFALPKEELKSLLRDPDIPPEMKMAMRIQLRILLRMELEVLNYHLCLWRETDKLKKKDGCVTREEFEKSSNQTEAERMERVCTAGGGGALTPQQAKAEPGARAKEEQQEPQVEASEEPELEMEASEESQPKEVQQNSSSTGGVDATRAPTVASNVEEGPKLQPKAAAEEGSSTLATIELFLSHVKRSGSLQESLGRLRREMEMDRRAAAGMKDRSMT